MEQDFMQELAPGRIFFDYGPVSMVVTTIRSGEGDTELCKEGFGVISNCLGELRPALEELRKYPPQVDVSKLSGTGLVMANAVLGTGDPWLTPMAAVAMRWPTTCMDGEPKRWRPVMAETSLCGWPPEKA